MARPTAPSLWLPGFDPAAPTLPRPAEQVCLSVSCEPAEPVEVIDVENLIDVEQEQFVATHSRQEQSHSATTHSLKIGRAGITQWQKIP